MTELLEVGLVDTVDQDNSGVGSTGGRVLLNTGCNRPKPTMLFLPVLSPFFVRQKREKVHNKLE